MIRIVEVFADGSSRTLSDKEVHDYGRNLNPHVDKRLQSVRKDATVPNVGDVVRLNDEGLRQIYGRTIGLSHMKSLEMRVTAVDDQSMTYPEPTFSIEVDNPEINIYLIDNHCFDIVRRASK